MTFGKAVLMLGSPGPDFNGPRALGHVTQNLHVDVDDVDAHYARAVEAGARIIEEPKGTFYGARRYGAEDLEGHRWYFAQDLRSYAQASEESDAPKAGASQQEGKRARPQARLTVTEEQPMRRIRYSVAMSLDGYIAGPNGEYDWIELDPSAGAEYFKAFYAQFDMALMGRKSYEQAGGGVSPLKTYVAVTHAAPR